MRPLRPMRHLAALLEVGHFQFEESDLMKETRHELVVAGCLLLHVLFLVSRPAAAHSAHSAIVVSLLPSTSVLGSGGRCQCFVFASAGEKGELLALETLRFTYFGGSRL